MGNLHERQDNSPTTCSTDTFENGLNYWHIAQCLLGPRSNKLNVYCFELGSNKHGLVTYIQVNVYIRNTLSWLNGGFDLVLYVPSLLFQLCRDGSFWVEPVSCSMTQRSDTGEARTRGPLVWSQALPLSHSAHTVPGLSKLTYVEDKIIISPLFLCIALIFLKRAMVQYTIFKTVFIESISVFIDISKKPRYLFSYFRHFRLKSSEINIWRWENLSSFYCNS